MLEERSAGAILFKRDGIREYLLLHYQAGHWDFPKGNIEPGENEIDTVRREIKEETSISNIRIIEGFKRKIEYNYKRAGKLIHKEVIFYLAETDESYIRLSYEHIGYKWLSYEEALKRLTYKNAKEILRAAEEFLMKN